MVFPPDTSSSITVYVNNVDIQKVTNFRYLGVVIDEDLKWTKHIEPVCNKLVKYTSIFYKLRDTWKDFKTYILCICSPSYPVFY